MLDEHLHHAGHKNLHAGLYSCTSYIGLLRGLLAKKYLFCPQQASLFVLLVLFGLVFLSLALLSLLSS